VVDHFASEYMKGRTPNPCISCNEHIKFRLFFKRAKQLGFDAIATGHYARLVYDENFKAYTLEEGEDPAKDQTYVLFPLDQEILSHLYLPVGGRKKSEIRQKARALGLQSVMEKPDSQEICFIPSNDHGTFLEKEFEAKKEPGNIRTREGKILGTHTGYYQYTRGQRRGLGVAHSERLYVLETLPETNEVVVGTKAEVMDLSFVVRRVNWLLRPWEKEGEAHPSLRAFVKIRSQHQKVPAWIEIVSEDEAFVTFETPQEAVTPGQAAVFYDGRRVLGGGWIG
jgi:tRNA-specific 2-thiouridylase